MLRWKNNTAGTIAAAITPSDVVISLTAGHGNRFPVTTAQDWFAATLRDAANNLEIIYVYQRDGDTFSQISRGQDGTLPIPCAAGDAIELRWKNCDVLGAQDESVFAPTSSGVNSYSANLRVRPKAYNSGQIYAVNIAAFNGVSNPLLNLSGLGAHTIKRKGSIPCAVGDCFGVCFFHFDGTDFIILNPYGGDEPPGTVAMTAVGAAPVGWLQCISGAQINRITDQALFNVIGTSYGAGDGSSTFNLPSLSGRIPIGTGASGLGNSYGLGQLYGAENVVLNEGQMPSHSHGVNDFQHSHSHNNPSHGHGYVQSNNTLGSSYAVQGPGPSQIYDNHTNTDDSGIGLAINASASNISIAGAGGNQPFSIVPPIFGINFIIKR